MLGEEDTTEGADWIVAAERYCLRSETQNL